MFSCCEYYHSIIFYVCSLLFLVAGCCFFHSCFIRSEEARALIASNCDKFPVNYDKFPVRICLLWITFDVRHCSTWNIWMLVFCCYAALPFCWPLCRPFCSSAGLCLSDGLLLVCWPLCRSAGFSAALLACCLRFGLPGDSRQSFSLSACAWCFVAGGYIAACCWSVPPLPSMLSCF